MRLVSVNTPNGPRIAVKRGGEYADVLAADAELPQTMRGLLEANSPIWRRVAAAAEVAPVVDWSTAKLLPPVHDPQKIICVGLNYADHAAETGATVGNEPVIFNKFPSTLIAHNEAIELPGASNEVDYEAELVVVVGSGEKGGFRRPCKNVSEKDAMQFVAGYTCGHDVSARDWQKGKPGGQWLLGKTFDTFAPLGPELVTADEIADPHNLHISFRLSGETMQNSHTSQLIFRIDYLVSYLSRVCELKPGDLIFTGTPPGVGTARQPAVYLKPGDTAEVEIEGIGTLTNRVRQAD